MKNLKTDLEARNVKFPQSASKSRLACIALRSRRGLLIYDVCSTSELRKFCTARRIQVPDLQRCNKKTLIERLEQDDAEAGFSRFEELPAELRVHVYEWHLQDMDWDDGLPARPPITQASRLLRRESMPIFYQNAPLSAFFNVIGGPSAYLFFNNAPADVLEMIPKFRMAGTGNIPGAFAGGVVFEFTLGNEGDDKDFKVLWPRDRPQENAHMIESRLRGLTVWDENGKLRLQRQHYAALCAIFT